MAKIKKTSEQEQALLTITGNLKTVKALNAYMAAAAGMNASVTFQAGKSKVSFDYTAADTVKLMTAYRKAMVAKTYQLADKYVIELDGDDIAILEEATPKQEKETAGTVAPKEASESAADEYEESDESESGWSEERGQYE